MQTDTEPRCTDVTLSISNPLDAYTIGDTIAGYVTLEIEKSLLLDQASVCLKCIETCTLEGFEQRRFTHYDQKVNILEERKDLILNHGGNVFPFEFLLSDETLGLLPTMSLDHMGGPDSGIEWLIKVDVRVVVGTESKCLDDVKHLSVYPKIPSEGENFTEVSVGRGQYGSSSVVLFKHIPRYFPCYPEKFNIGVVIHVMCPKYLWSLSAILKTIVHLRIPEEPKCSKKTLSSSFVLGKVCDIWLYPQFDDNLGVILENCGLDHVAPSAFRSIYVEVDYELVIEQVGFSRIDLTWKVQLMPL